MSLSTINVPVREALIIPAMTPTKRMQDWMLAVTDGLPTYKVLYLPDFGTAGDGRKDDTAAVQAAIDQAKRQGGGTIVAPPGIFSVNTLRFPTGNVPINLIGSGSVTIFKRRSALALGVGLFDMAGSNVTLESFEIDGNTTVPVPLLYNAGFIGIGNNDPMADSLTQNSSIWLHGGTSNFSCRRLRIRHTGGYAILLDAGQAGITDVEISACRFEDNRPHLFGAGAYAPIYGSWTGGIYVNGDGRTANPGCVLKRLTVSQCVFLRGTGNQVWSHLYGLEELHEAFECTGNYFQDIGLDGILIGGVTGGNVSQNDFRRIGYVCDSDTDRGTPRWLPNLNATALDSSGLAKGVNYQGNTFLSVNGGCMDLDGHGDSALTGNVARVPYPGEPEYDEDQIAISGPNNNASASYGINLGNTSNTPWGGKSVSIVGNTLINLPAGAVRLYSARDCLVTGNNIIAPDVPIAPPIAYGPGGTGANQRASGNIIKHNRFQYSPPAAAPCVFEDPTVGAFVASDRNYVFGNCPVIGVSGLATEFQKDPNSGSPVYLETVWFT